MQWSAQQNNFLKWCQTGIGSCILVAVAGAGKTTTLIEAARAISGQVAICAYNKKIAVEISAKLDRVELDWRKAQAGTVHSFGFKAYRKANPNVVVDDKKVEKLFSEMLGTALDERLDAFGTIILKLVGLAKERAVGIESKINDRTAWLNIVDHFDLIDSEDAEDALDLIIDAAMAVLCASNAQRDVIDFADMVYLTVLTKVKIWKFDVVMVDEAQDTNPARRALIKMMLKKGGRLIAVGDPAQAIYGFTGADNDSLDLIKKEFKAVELPLTVTYRCPQNVVSFARQWVSHIEAHESAPKGRVSTMPLVDFVNSKDLTGSDAVLCRNTKPLVELAFALIRKRVACKVEGRDIGNGIKKFVSRWKVKSLDALENKMDTHLEKQRTKLSAAGKDDRIQVLEDTVETVRVLIDECRSEGRLQVGDLHAVIDSIFGDNVTDILVLSTIHKSKGREWKRVFWLDRAGTCPSKYAKQAWAIKQENHLQYVAATRSMEELIELLPHAASREEEKEAA